MDARFGYYDNPAAAKFTKYLRSAGKVVSDSALPAATQQLVEIRASQINGCAVCTDMHTKDAAHAGETSVRLNLVATWPNRAPGSPTPPAASLTRPGRTRPSTTTTTSSPRWCPSSPSSTPGTA
jgi:AhpD family alkylhydroperoxidase